MFIFDTIVAECTAPYKSALSIIRLSGKDAKEILFKMVNKKDIKSHLVNYGSIYIDKTDKSTLIDKAIFVYFDAAHAYCGEDSVEFYVHGSRIIVGQIIEACLKYGARLAKGGEFSAKAYYNGKLNLTEAEAVNQVVNARTVRSKDFAVRTLGGENTKDLLQMKDTLNLLSAQIEINIDYPEFDDDTNLINKTKELLPELIKTARKKQSNSRQSKYLFNGVKVAIVGEPNVGKSTLLNKILGEDKAIVTNIPGTTRDIVEGEKEINGIIYKFFDTAGIRNGAGIIESIGIDKSRNICKTADIVMILLNQDQKAVSVDDLGILPIIKDKPLIKISTKRDIYGHNTSADISISKDDESLDELYKIIQSNLSISDAEEAGFVSTRDLDLLDKFVDTLSSIEGDLESQMTIDVIEVKIIEASKMLDELLGNDSTMEDIYTTIFSNFCVGK